MQIQMTLFAVPAEVNRVYRFIGEAKRRKAIQPGTKIRVLSAYPDRVLYCLANDPHGYSYGVGECNDAAFNRSYELVK